MLFSNWKVPYAMLRALNAWSCFKYLPSARLGFLLCSFLATFTSKWHTYKTLIKTLFTPVTLTACDHFLSCSIKTQLSADALNQGQVSGVGRFHTTSWKHFIIRLWKGEKIGPEGKFLLSGREIQGWGSGGAEGHRVQSLRRDGALVFWVKKKLQFSEGWGAEGRGWRVLNHSITLLQENLGFHPSVGTRKFSFQARGREPFAGETLVWTHPMIQPRLFFGLLFLPDTTAF